jgi:hypothetical protein
VNKLSDDVQAAVQAAALANNYELAAQLLKDVNQDRCFYCGGEAKRRKRTYLWCVLYDVPPWWRLIATPNGKEEPKKPIGYNWKPILLGWAHSYNAHGMTFPCVAKVKQFSDQPCSHDHK